MADEQKKDDNKEKKEDKPKLDANSQRVQDFINWCVQIANDNNPPHLYVWGAAGPDDFDCTGFLSYGLMQAGYDMQPCHGDAFDSGVLGCGWESVGYDDSMGTDGLEPGDILNNPNHVELYVGNGMVCGAHSAHKPAEDQISVEGWFADDWTNVYRFPGISGVTGPNGEAVKGVKGPRATAGPGGGGAYSSNIKDLGGAVELLPSKKTYCEPMYPDYLYVAGNIPCSAVEATAVNCAGQMDANSDYAVMTGQTMQDLMGLDMNAFTTPNAMALAQRSFDPSNAELEVKVPSAGKPLNNNDPFPTDLKIEELERHLPRVKQYKLPYNRKCGVSKTISSAILKISDWTEKRIVRLENILSTTMRYVYGMGSRMFINCQYYGGQDHRSKYCCIRCLKDDRTDDGQVMTIDQCLSCSRFEPIIGQTYDILNEVGANLANIEDDMQAGYMNMQDTLDFMRVEKMHKKKETFKLNHMFTHTKNINEYKFKDIWDDGVKMDWKLTPVESQKPQINWRTDINHEDKSPQKLDSYQAGPGQTGDNPGSTVQPGEAQSNQSQALDDMNKLLELDKKHDENASKDPRDKAIDDEWEANKNAIAGIKEGFAKMPDDTAKNTVEIMKTCGYEQAMQNACTANKADPTVVLSVVAMASGGDPKAGSSSKGGVFLQDGISNTDEPQKQFDEGVKKLYSDTKGSTSNPMGMIQSYFGGWNDSLEPLASGKYNEEWAVACGEGTRWIFPAFTKAYNIIKGCNDGASQAGSNINGGSNGVSFPIATQALNTAYIIQGYGLSSQTNAVATVSNSIVIKLPANTELHAPCSGGFSAMAYEDDRLGNHSEITDSSCGMTYIFGGLNWVNETPGKGFKKDDVFGYSTDRLVIQVKNSSGYMDPGSVWPMLNNKVSSDKSIGEQISAENHKLVNM